MRDKLFIDGKWEKPRRGGMLDVIDPATEEVIHRVPAATYDDIDRAVKAARIAFDSGPWPKLTGTERAVYLRAIAEKIEERRHALAHLEVTDNGKPLPEALWDIDDAAGCFRYYAGLAEELDANPEETIAVGDTRFRARAIREPLGIVGAITPWNYPLLMVSWKVAPALAAGCTMVLKPSELTPLTALELGAIAEEVELPPGVLNIVTGTGQDAGQPLTEHPLVDKLAFTGSVTDRAKGDDGRRPGHQEHQPRAWRQVALRGLCRQRYRKGRRMDHVRHLLEPGAGLLGNLARAHRGTDLRYRRQKALRRGGQDHHRQRPRRGHIARANRFQGTI